MAPKPNIAGRIGTGLAPLRRKPRTLVALPLVVVVFALIVAACSGVDDNGTTKDTLATQAARAALVPSPIPGAANSPASGSPVLTAGDPAAGNALYASQGCQGCHSVNGSKVVGPTWKGLYGSQVTLESGETVTADDAYIRESILQPQAKIVKGFASVQMPPFSLTDAQISDIIAYMKTLQ